MTRDEVTYDARIWSVHSYKGARGTTYRLKWRVGGVRHQRTFPTRKLAETFRASLLVGSREGMPFHLSDGLPAAMRAKQLERSWLQHAMAYVDVKWPAASARHRKGIAEALTDITLAAMRVDDRSQDQTQLRAALYRWAFNARARQTPVPDELEVAMAFLERNSPPLDDLSAAGRLRAVLDRLALRQDGTPAAASTVARKRATLNNVLEYAVELELFASNPLKKVKWKAPKATEVVDRRVVVNPTKARALLCAVWHQDPSIAAFFACMYYAGPRPAEVRALRVHDCVLPESGWGQILLVASHQTSGSAWTDGATSGEDRGLKHRGVQDTRLVPAHPDLVTSLRRHLKHFETGADGLLFVARTGRAGAPISPPYAKPIGMGTVYRAWHRARATVLTEREVNSMLARRPYDLRHACLSTWLNAGVPPARVAEWAGHSVDVLLRVYATCVEGDDELALKRISEALR